MRVLTVTLQDTTQNPASNNIFNKTITILAAAAYHNKMAFLFPLLAGIGGVAATAGAVATAVQHVEGAVAKGVELDTQIKNKRRKTVANTRIERNYGIPDQTYPWYHTEPNWKGTTASVDDFSIGQFTNIKHLYVVQGDTGAHRNGNQITLVDWRMNGIISYEPLNTPPTLPIGQLHQGVHLKLALVYSIIQVALVTDVYSNANICLGMPKQEGVENHIIVWEKSYQLGPYFSEQVGIGGDQVAQGIGSIPSILIDLYFPLNLKQQYNTDNVDDRPNYGELNLFYGVSFDAGSSMQPVFRGSNRLRFKEQ